MQKHEWRIQSVNIYGDYGYVEGPTLIQWLYKLESEGWEVFSVCKAYEGSITIVCRKPFVPAEIRNAKD